MGQIALLDIDPVGAKVTESKILEVSKDIEVLVVTANFSKEASIANAVAQVVDKFKLINNAIKNVGFGGPLVPLTAISDQDFSSVLDLNLKGQWLERREEIKQMLEQESLDDKYFPLCRFPE